MELKRDLEKLLAGEELRYPILDTITFEDIGRNPENIWSFLYYAGYLKAEDPAYNPLDRSTLTYAIRFRTTKSRWSTSNSSPAISRSRFTGRDERCTLVARLIALRLAALRSAVAGNGGQSLQLSRYRQIPGSRLPRLHPRAARQPARIYEIHSNPETGYGRADILLRPRGERFPLGFVIEFKSLPRGRRPGAGRHRRAGANRGETVRRTVAWKPACPRSRSANSRWW